MEVTWSRRLGYVTFHIIKGFPLAATLQILLPSTASLGHVSPVFAASGRNYSARWNVSHVIAPPSPSPHPGARLSTKLAVYEALISQHL